jgi:hypothetical protein
MKKLFLMLFAFLAAFNTVYSQDVLISGDIGTNLTLTADKTYTLVGIVRVQSGATLTIQPGTKIYGQNSTQGSLVIKPGGKINAQGTKENPIVFTSEFTKPGASRQPTYGDWGGIIVLGNAPINVPGGTAAIEGPGDIYGGTNSDDNSGVMRYVRIEYPGIAYSLNNEINGLTFGGVGRGTTIEYIQVSYSGDDSFEWFGGNVNCKYLIAYRGWDDDFDTDYGYSGKLQFLLSVRDPNIADQSSSNGFESDNDGSGSTNNPRTSPTYYNVTLIGPAATTSTTYNSLYRRGMHLRRSSQNKIYNALIMGWPDGVLIDGTNTVADAKNGITFLKNSIISGSVSGALKSTDAQFQTEMPTWFNTNQGRIYTTNAEVKLSDPFNVASPNPMPLFGSPVFSGAATPPNDGFFDTSANFVGAFGTKNWAVGWSSLDFPTSVKINKVEEIPTSINLSQNYPNPFNPSTTINFTIVTSGQVKLSVYNILGQQVAQLVNGYKEAGTYTLNWDASNLSSGIYLYRLESSGEVLSKKMNLLK